MTGDGDTLWAWQSQQPLGFQPATDMPVGRGPRYEESHMAMVLVHRDREQLTNGLAKQAVLLHQRKFDQPVRLAQFTLAQVEETRG